MGVTSLELSASGQVVLPAFDGDAEGLMFVLSRKEGLRRQSGGTYDVAVWMMLIAAAGSVLPAGPYPPPQMPPPPGPYQVCDAVRQEGGNDDGGRDLVGTGVAH